jgi:ISXO2-like transposase domain
MIHEWVAYTGLRQHFNHYTVNHGAGEYVAKDSGAHINSMEGVLALLKRQIYRIHHGSAQSICIAMSAKQRGASIGAF